MQESSLAFNQITRKLILFILASIILIQLTGCSAIHTAIKKSDLDVQTKMSETVFLEPVSPKEKIIFIDVRNTTDKKISISTIIEQSIQSRGYKITADPAKANFMLQANILKIGKTDLRSSQSALASGYGGAVAGAVIASHSNSSGRSVAKAGLFGALLGIAADAMVEDILYNMITDLQIRERPRNGEVITQSQSTAASQGTSTRMNQKVTGGKVRWKTYRTRIVSTANQVNLKYEEAKGKLIEGLTRSISGVF